MSIWDASLETANRWYDISWYGLLVAGLIAALASALTIAFLFVQFWSTGVRDRHAELRTSALELETENAKAEAAKANRGAADAKLALEKFKSARVLTNEQIESVKRSIASFRGQRFAMWTYWLAIEPPAFAKQLKEEVLGPAGWEFAADLSKDPLTGVSFGVQVIASTRSTPEQQLAGRSLVAALLANDITAFFRLYEHSFDDALEIQVGIKS